MKEENWAGHGISGLNLYPAETRPWNLLNLYPAETRNEYFEAHTEKSCRWDTQAFWLHTASVRALLKCIAEAFGLQLILVVIS